MTVHMYSDGGARGNPGPAGVGVVIQLADGTVLATLAKPLGVMTNNQAEYWAVIFGLEKLDELVKNGQDVEEVTAHLDSELVVQQLNGRYKVKNQGLKPLYDRVQQILQNLSYTVTFRHIPRHKNKQADALANEAMDVVEPKGS